MRKAISEVKDVEAHWCLWPPVLFWHAGLPGKMKSIYDLGLFSWYTPALQSLADRGKQEGEADWVVFMQLVGGNRQCFQRQQVVSAGVRPNSHELLSWHPENKTCSVRPGCCAKKPLLGGKAGNPGRKANQEVKLSCQLNSLGRMWPAAAYFAIALNTSSLCSNIYCCVCRAWLGVLATALSWGMLLP